MRRTLIKRQLHNRRLEALATNLHLKRVARLRVRERHAGLHPDWQTPRWHTIVELVGSGEALAELTSAELRELDPWGHDAADRRHAFGPDRRLELLVDGPRHGTLTMSPDGGFHYVADPGFVGTDAFTYRADDGAMPSNLASVWIIVP